MKRKVQSRVNMACCANIAATQYDKEALKARKDGNMELFWYLREKAQYFHDRTMRLANDPRPEILCI